jgi:two-component system OmpR family sensor kinase
MTLRRRLTVTLALLLAVGLAVADVVTYTAVRSFLYGRADVQVDTSARQALSYLQHLRAEGRTPSVQGLEARVGPDVYVEVLGPGGTVALGRPSGSADAPDPAPVLPKGLRVSLAPARRVFGNRLGVYHPLPEAFTVSAAAPSHAAYRAEALASPFGTLVVAVPLQPADDTLAALRTVELAVSLGLLVTLCAVAWFTVGRGLRPLRGMAETADAFAAGDLSRRVDPANPRTELGRFGTALNRMLAETEATFTDKTASEARLRQFVADASHELRTPLTSIRGYAELLRKGAFTDEEGRQRALRRVEAEAARMGGLVDDLLLLARLDQRRPLAVAPVDLSRLAGDACHDARAVDPGRPYELVAPEAVVVRGDRDRLGQVLQNLLGNVRLHTPDGTPVKVEVVAEGPVGVLRVVDRGPGVPPDVAARVFDRFYRGDPSRTGGGTGLGLAIVRAIAEAQGGTAEVSPTPGGGATFTVTVPLDRPLDRTGGRRSGTGFPAEPPGDRQPELTR